MAASFHHIAISLNYPLQRINIVSIKLSPLTYKEPWPCKATMTLHINYTIVLLLFSKGNKCCREYTSPHRQNILRRVSCLSKYHHLKYKQGKKSLIIIYLIRFIWSFKRRWKKEPIITLIVTSRDGSNLACVEREKIYWRILCKNPWKILKINTWILRKEEPKLSLLKCWEIITNKRSLYIQQG